MEKNEEKKIYKAGFSYLIEHTGEIEKAAAQEQ